MPGIKGRPKRRTPPPRPQHSVVKAGVARSWLNISRIINPLNRFSDRHGPAVPLTSWRSSILRFSLWALAEQKWRLRTHFGAGNGVLDPVCQNYRQSMIGDKCGDLASSGPSSIIRKLFQGRISREVVDWRRTERNRLIELYDKCSTIRRSSNMGFGKKGQRQMSL